MIYLLQHLLTASAKKYPNKEAVIFENERITYKQLDEISDSLATVLRKNGISNGDRVGIYVNKSIASVICIFGILKAGAVYVPLDPKSPFSRISYIIQNCGIECLLTSTEKIESEPQLLSKDLPLRSIILTDNSVNIVNRNGSNVIPWKSVVDAKDILVEENPCLETDLAYILYTSGSTGVPKGVMISHLNAFTFLKWVQSTFNLDPNDRLSNHAPLHFDLSIMDIFGAFQAGATTVLVPEITALFPHKLATWIEENKITVWYSVPSILTKMVLNGQMERYQFENLRLILFAGEVFPTKYLRSLMEKIPHVEYYNLYGPTETNVITYYKVKKIPPEQTNPIPIGKACANMEVFALKENGQVVEKPGDEGELYARGSCVAQGYWGDKEKTNKNFVFNPLQANFAEKVYRTGDLVTLDEHGNFLYNGRLDHQIKSRGYRIELGEIETALYSHDSIKEAAVVAIPDELIGHRIKAFIVCKDHQQISLTDLRIYCGEKLPPYMIPEDLEFRQSLPQTSTGKVDKTFLSLESKM
jgi:amino acid adenylation domain-containing protein